MSLAFISHRERITVTTYARHFEYADTPGAGFAFDCTADGTFLRDMPDAAEANLQRCLDGTYDVVDLGIQVYQHSYWEPAAVRCDCYATIWLEDAMTNECGRCGLLCNGSGQRLAPVSQWEPEDVYDTFGPR